MKNRYGQTVRECSRDGSKYYQPAYEKNKWTNFVSAIIVHGISWAGDIGLLIQGGLMQVRMHHTGKEDRSRGGIRFYGVGCAVAHSDFAINPAILAELVLDSSPRHALFQICQLASRVYMVPK